MASDRLETRIDPALKAQAIEAAVQIDRSLSWFIAKAISEKLEHDATKKVHAPWCTWNHDGPCPAENELGTMS